LIVSKENVNITTSGGLYTLTLRNMTIEELGEILKQCTDYENEEIENLDMVVENPLGAERLKEAYHNMKSGQLLYAVKLVKEGFGIGLKDAKDLVDTLRNNDLRENVEEQVFSRWSYFNQEQREHLSKAFSPSQMRKWRGTIAGSKFGV
jgi:ribosomal protein L7/L12